MASSDLRDILNVKASGPRPAKKHKPNPKRPDNITKEVFSLIGERAPPVVLQPERYQKRPKFTRKVQPWEVQSFTNRIRADGLVLRHWAKKTAQQSVTPADASTPAGNDALESSAPTPAAPAIRDNEYWVKYNTEIKLPTYTDEQYVKHLQSEAWTREETDYLMALAKSFDLRWVVIVDRYDYRPVESPENGDAMAFTPTSPVRSMESLKARYYEIAAKMMAVRTPLASMSKDEFELHEKMVKFDPTRETTRKRLVEALFHRTPEEVKEEEILLAELKRIVVNEDRFLDERKNLYETLNYPIAQGSISSYESSGGLVQLMQTLLAADKAKKKKAAGASSAGPGDSTSSPALLTATHPPPSATSTRGARDSLPSATHKKGNTSASGAASHRPQLSAKDEARFGVSHHDKLSSGVAFRQHRIEKLVLARSTAQQQKLQDALAELSVPVRAVMPTARVCAEYERVVGAIHGLLEVRKIGEKVTNEIRVLQTQKAVRERRERGEPDEGRADESMSQDAHEHNDEIHAHERKRNAVDVSMDMGDSIKSETGAGDETGNRGETSEANGEDDQGDGDEEPEDVAAALAQADADDANETHAVGADLEKQVHEDEEGEGSGLEEDGAEEEDSEDDKAEEADGEDADDAADEGEEDGGGGDDDENGEGASGPVTEDTSVVSRTSRRAAAHKRSASVLSGVSSDKSTKRARK